MLQASHGMHRDAVEALHKPGVFLTDIYERDRQINRYERDVRRKILTHLSVSQKPDVDLALIITAIVIDIERIGDLTKNIAELAAGSPAAFDCGELKGEIAELEGIVDGMFADIGPALKTADQERAKDGLKRRVRRRVGVRRRAEGRRDLYIGAVRQIMRMVGGAYLALRLNIQRSLILIFGTLIYRL